MSGYGFFRPEEVTDQNLPQKHGVTYSCYSCGLFQHVKSPRMAPWGDNEKGIICIGEAPGETEDDRGRPWQGKTGRRLQSELRRLNVELAEDCVSFNAVQCRPLDDKGNNREPTDHEVNCCRVKYVFPYVEEYNASLIMLFGSNAVQSLINDRTDTKNQISIWRGWTIPDQKLKRWICPVFHPSFVEREEDRKEITTIWRQDLERAIDKVNRPVPNFSHYKENLRLLHNEEDIISLLERICRREEGQLCAFDYEGTGLKPHAEGHKIVCTSIATERASYAFMGPRTPRVMKLFQRFLRSPNILKIAQNLKFEDTWSVEKMGVDSVRGWEWDPMLAAHVIDNRQGVTGLKFQTYVNFGIGGYDKAVSKYLEGTDRKNANSINRIDEAIANLGEDVVLEYCASDSLFARWLAVKQMSELGHVVGSRHVP